MKSTLKKGVKRPETVRLQAVGGSSPPARGDKGGLTACLLHNEPTSYSSLARLRLLKVGAAAKASLNRAYSQRG